FILRGTAKTKGGLGFAKLLSTELVNRDLHFTLHYADTIRSGSRVLLDRSLGVYAFDELVVLYKSKVPASPSIPTLRSGPARPATTRNVDDGARSPSLRARISRESFSASGEPSV